MVRFAWLEQIETSQESVLTTRLTFRLTIRQTNSQQTTLRWSPRLGYDTASESLATSDIARTMAAKGSCRFGRSWRSLVARDACCITSSCLPPQAS